ncbi:hypothetical protein OU789_02580 [Halocynthiibacter sp. C4]|uniref:hypothetical protein n=1 Tax=Halocynthiibacter sp. C4 TaxID=2992758 RepID=UPI00237AFA06|nr:hypothetical protein [Halocynthiibacter sp. C4]MDE0588808.1 hypothetical protein [Halocynthiibacter sp. C4]
MKILKDTISTSKPAGEKELQIQHSETSGIHITSDIEGAAVEISNGAENDRVIVAEILEDGEHGKSVYLPSSGPLDADDWAEVADAKDGEDLEESDPKFSRT